MTTAAASGPPAESRQIDGMGKEELRGRSAGIFVCAVMGFTWAASAVGALTAAAAVPVLIASLVTSAVLLIGARRLRRSGSFLPASSSPGADRAKVRRRFNLVVLAEFLAIAVAINVLSRLGHSQWIPAVICAAVGLHFIPLARLFRVRLYDATAAALCLAAVATMALGAAGASESVWHLVPGLGAALALWATGARLLVTTVTPALPVVPPER